MFSFVDIHKKYGCTSVLCLSYDLHKFPLTLKVDFLKRTYYIGSEPFLSSNTSWMVCAFGEPLTSTTVSKTVGLKMDLGPGRLHPENQFWYSPTSMAFRIYVAP